MTRKRLPSLDGLRGFSIGMVILAHVVHAAKTSVGRLPYGMGLVEDWGSVGVTVFFVISGFIITTLLCQERVSQGSISLRGFYVRRIFRIVPAYWTYLAAIVALSVLGAVTISARSLSAAFAFVSDYLQTDAWVLGHSWSLSVEEQFYLFWPALLVVVGRLRSRHVAIGLILATPVARVLTYHFTPSLRPTITAMMHLRVDALMIGCWAALERERDPASRALSLLSRPMVALLGAASAVVLSPLARHLAGDFAGIAICYSIEAFGACSVLLWAISNPLSPAGRALNASPIARIGVLSYSLYLWQQPWLNPAGGLPLWTFPLLVLGAYGCAELSYRFVEAPARALGSRVLAAGLPARAVGA